MRYGTQLIVFVIVTAVFALLPEGAWANQLQVDPAAPWWAHAGAKAILYTHISGGTVGLISGTIAMLSRKGGKLHRAAGNVFVVAMLIMAGIGALVAPLLHDRISTVGGYITCYLIFTAWLTARRRDGVSRFEIAGLIVAVAGMLAMYVLVWLAAQTPEGTLDGSPKEAFYIFGFVTTIAALSDLKLVLRGGIAGAERIARHVWRMCFGLFVASGSLFMGNMQVFPEWLRHTPVLYILALAPLPFLLFWMLRVRLSKKWRGASRQPVPAPA